MSLPAYSLLKDPEQEWPPSTSVSPRTAESLHSLYTPEEHPSQSQTFDDRKTGGIEADPGDLIDRYTEHVLPDLPEMCETTPKISVGGESSSAPRTRHNPKAIKRKGQQVSHP